MQFLYEKSTNIRYWLNQPASPTPLVDNEQPVLNLLGVRFQIDVNNSQEQVNTKITTMLSNIAWFSYRKNFEALKIPVDNKIITNDSGWGCVIRAGQMLLFTLILKIQKPGKFEDKSGIDEDCFRILQDYFLEKIEKEEKTHKKKKDIKKKEVENLKENEEKSQKIGIFALQNFVKTAKIRSKLKEGSWFRPTTFVDALEGILALKNPIGNFRIHNVFEHALYFKPLCQKVFKDYENLEIKSIEKAVELLKTKKWDGGVLLNTCVMLGINKTIEPKYKDFLKMLVETDSFVGILGGYQQRAFFFVGSNETLDFYYLDPHYVRESLADFGDEKVLREQYFEKNFMRINYQKMSSSLMVSHFLSSKDDFENLWTVLEKLKGIYESNFILGYLLDEESGEGDYDGSIQIIDQDVSQVHFGDKK